MQDLTILYAFLDSIQKQVEALGLPVAIVNGEIAVSIYIQDGLVHNREVSYKVRSRRKPTPKPQAAVTT